MKCPKCGEELPDGAKYCHRCGPISTNEEVQKTSKLPDPSELDSDKNILSTYFDVSRRSYMNHPNNRKERAFLDNNRELFQISSYFDVPRDPTLLLSEWGLPEKLRENLYLDDNRKEAFDYVLNAPLDRNIVLIGDPGVGKTALLFAVFDKLMKESPVGVLSTTGISGYHSKNGIKLFYDDIPENLDMAKAIEETAATGIVVSAREQDFKHRLNNVQQGMFEKVFIKPFSEEDIQKVAENLFRMQGLSYEQDALELVSKYARGTPIYVWSLVRDLVNRGKSRLTVDYLEENASGGMTAYINRLLMRLLRDGEEYKKGALHTLTVLVFLATQVRDRRSPSLYLRKVSDLLEEHTVRVFGSRLATYDLELQMRTLSYLSGKGKMYRFPHDCWADVLCGDVQSPFSSRIDFIFQEFEIGGLFGSVKKEALSRTWKDIKNMYMKNPSRYRKSALEFIHFSLQNFEIEELEESDMKVKTLRRMLAKEQGHPLAEASLSIIERSQPSVSNMINIQDSVMMRSQIGQGNAGMGGGDVEVKDSVVQRSTVGGAKAKNKAKDRCPECGNLITADNKVLKCKECGKRFCSTCEEWIDKVDEYRGKEVRTRYPLCEDCYASEVEGKKAEIDERIQKEEERRRKAEQEKRERELLSGLTTTQNAIEKQKAWARKVDAPVDWQNSIGMKFKLIPAGEFMMGSEKWDSSKPVHKVKITEPFYIGVYPVTQREWKAVMGENPSEFKGDDLPVEKVSWDDCQEFIRKLNSRETGHEYRLPTEAEWEYACRAGSQGKYCFGDGESKLSEYAWYRENSGVEKYKTVEKGVLFKKKVQEKEVEKRTHPVGEKKPNLFELYDMHGNVWEWCEDWYDSDYYERGPKEDPTGPSSGSLRVNRGGSWFYDAEYCASAFRYLFSPVIRLHDLGFRLVRSI